MQKLLFLSFFCFISCQPNSLQLDSNVKEYAKTMQLKLLAYSCNSPSPAPIGCVRCDIKIDTKFTELMSLDCCDDFCRLAYNKN